MSRDLAAELVACDWWVWLPGMLFVRPDGWSGGLVIQGDASQAIVVGEDIIRMNVIQVIKHTPPNLNAVPDLSDAATVGCLMDWLGRKLRNIHRAQWQGEVKWTVSVSRGGDVVVAAAPTLGEALALALLDVGPEVVDG